MTQSLPFSKYHGAGNDFIIVDAKDLGSITLSESQIALWCHRRFGIGADGFMVYEGSTHTDKAFTMRYYNADGKQGSMCGNGGRCIVRYAYERKGAPSSMQFRFGKDVYRAEVHAVDNISLNMLPVRTLNVQEDHSCFCDTGSPHHVEWVDSGLHKLDVSQSGRSMRDRYGSEGCNINFVEIINDSELAVRTYERGVEDETLACGTGVTAAVLSAHHMGKIQSTSVKVNALGGLLEVDFKSGEMGYEDIVLTGPAEYVFDGNISLQ